MHTKTLLVKYGPYLYREEPFDIGDIGATDQFHVCTHGTYTSGGMDGWGPRDFSLLPLHLFTYLACRLNGIERGLPWPRGVLHGKATMLEKDPKSLGVTMDDFRVLLILSVLYRKWATTDFSDCCPGSPDGPLKACLLELQGSQLKMHGGSWP